MSLHFSSVNFQIILSTFFFILQVFELLWCLVCHDIWFVWERSDFLLQSDDSSLLTKQFTVSQFSIMVINLFCLDLP